MNVSIEDALREFGLKPEREPEWYKVLCPFHDDSKASGRIHHKTGVYKCWVCDKVTSFSNFLARYSNLPLYQVKRRMGLRSDCKNPIPSNEVEADHVRIWEHKLFIHELHQRCITAELIRYYRLGIKEYGTEKRISIPIPNEIGEWASLRLYLPGATEYKFLNLSGADRSKIRLYPIEQLEFDQILICGGELKAVAAAAALNKYGIGAIAPTCGEPTWPNELNYRFENKLIWVNCDIDTVGKKAAESRCKILNTVARETHKVTFTPDEVGGIEKGDINDFLRLGGDLYKKLLTSPEYVYIPGGETDAELSVPVTFRAAYSSINVGKKVSFTGTVAGILPKSYTVAHEVKVKCPRDQDFCQLCDVNSKALTSDGTLMTIGKEHPALLSLTGEKTIGHNYIYKECFRIPTKCRVCEFEPKTYHDIREIRLDEALELTSKQEPVTNQIAFTVDTADNLLDASVCIFEGRMYPSPKDQSSTFIISSNEPIQDSLDNYQPMPVDNFKDFIPREWTLDGIRDKLKEIYDDLEANVTRVWQRRDYHIAIDLVYHSILHFEFLNLGMVNGYVELLVVGDTEQAKSRTGQFFREHYRLGKKIDCKNVTLPGLIIGLEKTSGGKYFHTIGAMPKNDRMLLFLEELGGMNPKIFQSLTEVRSSGFVEINKIEHKIRRARARLVALTNCAEGREIASYSFGVEAALGVIGTNQDLRRFDFVLIMAKADIKELVELRNPPQCEHRFNSDLCQKLVLKAWKCDSVTFEDADFILETSALLVDKYGHGSPILGAGSSHIKIAKLSAALAARTCSYSNNDVLIVRKCHTEYIAEYLNRIYSAPSSRLDQKSLAIKNSTKLRNINELTEYLKSLSNCVDTVEKLLEIDVITSEYIKNICGDSHIGATLFSKLILSNAIIRIKSERYAKSPEFTALLKSTTWEMKRPPYLPGDV